MDQTSMKFVKLPLETQYRFFEIALPHFTSRILNKVNSDYVRAQFEDHAPLYYYSIAVRYLRQRDQHWALTTFLEADDEKRWVNLAQFDDCKVRSVQLTAMKPKAMHVLPLRRNNICFDILNVTNCDLTLDTFKQIIHCDVKVLKLNSTFILNHPPLSQILAQVPKASIVQITNTNVSFGEDLFKTITNLMIKPVQLEFDIFELTGSEMFHDLLQMLLKFSDSLQSLCLKIEKFRDESLKYSFISTVNAANAQLKAEKSNVVYSFQVADCCNEFRECVCKFVITSLIDRRRSRTDKNNNHPSPFNR